MRSKHAWGMAAVVVVSAFGAAAVTRGAAGPDSGPAIGEPVGAFDVYDITGPSKGTELCYR
jgi:hypothetical protein